MKRIEEGKRKKRPRKKKDTAVMGKLSIYLSPEMRAFLDDIAREERVSLNSIGVFSLSVFVSVYRKLKRLPKEMMGVSFELKRPGARRKYTRIEE